MRINRMTASFGKLDNQSLQLGNGLNIVTAPNEGGKSTWASFLKAMLYGIDSRERDKKGFIADKNRYQPWSGKPMVGQLDLSWGDRDITLRRQPKGAVPFANFSATYQGTDSPVAGLTEGDCGFVLTGVERQVYERSAFLGAGSHAVTATPELERRIAALVTTGEEDISFSQVETQLREWGRFRRVNKSVGRIPKLEVELEQVEATLRLLTQLNEQISAATGDQLQLTNLLAQLDGELAHHNQWETQRKNQKFTAAKEGLDEAQRQLDALLQQTDRQGELPSQERLRHWQGELAVIKAIEKELKEGESHLLSAESALSEAQLAGEDAHFGGLPSADALGLAQRETTSYEKSKEEAVKLNRQPLSMTLGTLFCCGVILGLAAYLNRLQDPYPYAMCGLFALTWMGGLVRTKKQKNQLTHQMSALLARYQIEKIEDLTALAEDYALRQQNIAVADTALRQLSDHRRLQRDKGDSLQTRLMEFVQTFSPKVQSLIGCSAAISRGLQIGEELAVAEARLSGAHRLFASVAEEGGQLDDASPIAAPTRPAHQIAAQRSGAAEELRRVEDSLSQLLGRQQASGDPAALAAQRELLQQELSRRNQELAAIQTALDALQAANIRLQERFSPQLNAKAGQYLSYLTGGKYDGLSLNRELEGAVTQVGDVLPRSALYLSRGTADQLYFALRLAVYDLCLPTEETVPLVLDDALTAFDQPRMERALDLLCQLAETRQIILFSCHQREREYLKGRDGVHFSTI